MRCGKTSGTDAFLYRDWNGDRNADRGKCDYCDRSRSLSALRISYVLQIKIPHAFARGIFKFEFYALSTFPDLRQEVHTYIFLAPPVAVLTFTDFTLDFHILLDLLWE